MSYHQLFYRAYGLCVRCNSHAIANDLPFMTESELAGVINFLSQLQGG
jgi:coenzyme F420-reducing hydrogenase alpha subunit